MPECTAVLDLNYFGFRTCTQCGVTKPQTEFYFKGLRPPLKRRSICKRCTIGPLKGPRKINPIPWIDRGNNRKEMNERRKIKYHQNLKKMREYASHSYYKNWEKIRERRKKFYAENRAEEARRALISHKKNYATARAWKAKNKDKVRRYNRQFSLRHPGHHIPHRHRRRARKANCEGKLSRGIRKRLLIEQRGLCVYCKADLHSTGCHLDHLIPLALGGPNTDNNIQLTCPTCNQRKHKKHPIDFAFDMGILKNPELIPI